MTFNSLRSPCPSGSPSTKCRAALASALVCVGPVDDDELACPLPSHHSKNSSPASSSSSPRMNDGICRSSMVQATGFVGGRGIGKILPATGAVAQDCIHEFVDAALGLQCRPEVEGAGIGLPGRCQVFGQAAPRPLKRRISCFRATGSFIKSGRVSQSRCSFSPVLGGALPPVPPGGAAAHQLEESCAPEGSDPDVDG